MAFFRVQSGGSLSETVLWTNSAPTSYIYGYPELSQSMDNFDYLKFYYRPVGSSATEETLYVKVSEFKNSTAYHCPAFYGYTTVGWARPVLMYDNGLYFSQCLALNTAAGRGDGLCVPTKICGCS